MFMYVIVISLMTAAPAFSSGQSEDTASDGPVTLSWWHLWGGSRTELIDAMAEEYTAMHPNVSFDVTFTPPNDLMKKVIQAAGTGTLPDIVQIHSGWYTNLMPEETLEDLTPYAEKDKLDLKASLVDAERIRSYWDGKLYSLPNVNAGAQGLFFYNKDLMRQAGLDPVKDAPRNWKEFSEVSRILVEKLNNGKELDVIAWDPNQMAGQPSLIVFSYGAGNPTVSKDSKTSLLTTPGVMKAAKAFDDYMTGIYGSYGGYRGVLEWNSRVAGADTGAAQVQAFINGNQVFYVSGSWTIGQVKSGNPDMDFGILPVPGFEREHGGTAKNGWSYSISKSSKNKAAAWDFLKFITIDPAGNGEFCIAQGRPSPINSVNKDTRFLTDLGDELWTNLVNSMNLDIVPEALDVHQDTLKPWLRDIPSRRIAGESLDAIMADINNRYQDYLNDING